MLYHIDINGETYDVLINNISKPDCNIEFEYKNKKYIIFERLSDKMDNVILELCIKSLLCNKIASINKYDESYKVASEAAKKYGLKIVEDFPE